MNDQPLETRCDHCKQTRPLFLYEPEHNIHALGYTCEWCLRRQQPLLCSRCWSKEREREENAPVSAEELAATEGLYWIVATNERLIKQAEADKATCDGIARATRQSEGGAR
ncbi:hypothetical protein [Streptomyces sp. NPDC001404]|uniref:hypothetical protein n=1 Tax=Streptomyces sp. NPDC001404 TaxID=3364571 RepID=UPI0036B1DE83